ncbi:MAG: tRNA lysidine(34) synthetase TilS [Parachlamydiaceae bacterium]
MMLPPFSSVKDFLLKHISSSSPFLLALSGGSDSLFLFYALLELRQDHGVLFHVAHVDHGWRQESQEEAKCLEELACQHDVPFHLKILNPLLLKGNLEAASREERYRFFFHLMNQLEFQALLTGHHQDDLAETVFKRLFEGAHWSRWAPIKSERLIKGARILRPLLTMRKNEIKQALNKRGIHFFADPTNYETKYLRARLRETIFPRLNQEFGKEIQKSLIKISQEAEELISFFEERLNPLIDLSIRGPFGLMLDLKKQLPHSLVEIKQLLRLLCDREGFFLSREVIEQGALALQLGRANQLFLTGFHRLYIDRKVIFILPPSFVPFEIEPLALKYAKGTLGNWVFTMKQEIKQSQEVGTNWRNGWLGHLKGYLPIGDYTIGFRRDLKNAPLKKWWNEAKTPAFLYPYFPLIWQGDEIYHEFLTGKSFFSINEGELCLKIELMYILQD